MSAPNTHAVEAKAANGPWREHRAYPSFEAASAAMAEILAHEKVCPACSGCRVAWRVVELSAAHAVPAAVLERKKTLEALPGVASVRVMTVDELLGEKPAPAPENPPPVEGGDPVRMTIYLASGDCFDVDTTLGAARDFEKANEDGKLGFVFDADENRSALTIKLHRVVAYTIGAIPADDPLGDDVAALKARVTTLTESEARAVAGEKEARDALTRAGETIAELTARYAAPKVEA